MKIKKSNRAIAEIISTILLCLIAIFVLSVIYFYVLSDDGPNPETYVKIVGSVIGSNVILEHHGGESLSSDTKINITIIQGIQYINTTVGNLLNDENNNKKWDLSERIIYPVNYNLSMLGQYRKVDVLAIDDESNSIVLIGPIELHPVSDAGMTITVNNTNPIIGDIIKIKITVTSYGGDVNGSGNVSVRCILSDELNYVNSSSPTGHGPYNNVTGIWYTGDVLVEEPAQLYINVKVSEKIERDLIQLAVMLDGSSSIISSDWSIMKSGLARAINNSLPHDGSVELTVIQFGGWYIKYSEFPRAEIEISPIIVTDDKNDLDCYYQNISNYIQGINQLKGFTPMGCGIRLAADQLHNNGNFSPDKKQIILLVTDGEPNCVWIPSSYNATHEDYSKGKTSAEKARKYLINTLELNHTNDEFDSLAIGEGPDIAWLNKSIVWPQPGNSDWPPTSPGWVRKVDTWQEFVDSIEEIFNIIFSGYTNTVNVELVSSTTLDPNDKNKYDAVLIIPND